ncbi:MAG TPA: FAD-binding oxidoreductase [Methylomirabilota bacterium]|nr:FAD-binding oxidoreductase [Methylomirabilota bacterium]
MTVSAPALEDALAEIVGRPHVVSDPAALSAASIDGRQPRWLVSPGSTDEVSRILALCSTERLAVAPRGSGSTMGLGNPPRRLDLVVDMSRLAAVLDYVPEDMVATVQAGLTLDGLASVLGKHAQMLALDPHGGAARSIGGVLATNASGPLRFRYGTGRDLLLGVRFAQADGTVTWGGAKVVKSVTGYDVPKLLAGSLGTLGLIAEATLRLHPAPVDTGSWLFAFDGTERAGDFLSAILASTLEPDRLAWLNDGALRGLGQPPALAALCVSISTVPEAVRSQGATLVALGERSGGRAVMIPAALWTKLGEALGAPLVLRIAGEIRGAARWAGEVESIASRQGLSVAIVGEAGNGILRVALTGAIAPDVFARELVAPLRAALQGEGGSLVIERAPLPLKGATDVWGPVPEIALGVMRRLKAEFDPLGILNPGRFVGGL